MPNSPSAPSIPVSENPTKSVGSDELELSREFAHRYRFSSVDAAVAFLRQRGIKPIIRGRAFLWRRAEVDALFTGGEGSKP